MKMSSFEMDVYKNAECDLKVVLNLSINNSFEADLAVLTFKQGLASISLTVEELKDLAISAKQSINLVTLTFETTFETNPIWHFCDGVVMYEDTGSMARFIIKELDTPEDENEKMNTKNILIPVEDFKNIMVFIDSIRIDNE